MAYGIYQVPGTWYGNILIMEQAQVRVNQLRTSTMALLLGTIPVDTIILPGTSYSTWYTWYRTRYLVPLRRAWHQSR